MFVGADKAVLPTRYCSSNTEALATTVRAHLEEEGAKSDMAAEQERFQSLVAKARSLRVTIS